MGESLHVCVCGLKLPDLDAFVTHVEAEACHVLGRGGRITKTHILAIHSRLARVARKALAAGLIEESALRGYEALTVRPMNVGWSIQQHYAAIMALSAALLEEPSHRKGILMLDAQPGTVHAPGQAQAG